MLAFDYRSNLARSSHSDMPHFTIPNDNGDWNEDEVLAAFAQKAKTRRLSEQRPSPPNQLPMGAMSTSDLRLAGLGKTLPWPNRGVAPIGRRSTPTETKQPSPFANAQQLHRASPSGLRATAPAFDIPGNNGDHGPVDNDAEEDELADRLESTHIYGVQQGGRYPQARYNSYPYPNMGDGGTNVTASPKTRTSYTGSPVNQKPYGKQTMGDGSTAPLSLVESAPDFLPTAVNQNYAAKPRANTFSTINNNSNNNIPKLPKTPTHTFADFNAGAIKKGLHPTSSCYAVVEFKTFRAEVYQMRLDWSAMSGVSVVIVEADRGYDLGKVHLVTSNIEEARKRKKDLYAKHWQVLIDTSSQKAIDFSTSAQCFEAHYAHIAGSPHASGFTGSMAPKSIVAKATADHMQQLQLKEGAEEKAKRACQKIADNLGMKMEILAAEFQFDWQKLTLFYLSPEYIQYERISNEIFKLYKCRLWYTALNPASFHPPKGDARTIRRANSGTTESPTFSPPMPHPQVPLPEVQHIPNEYFMSDHKMQSNKIEDVDYLDPGYNGVTPIGARTSPWNDMPPQFTYPLVRQPWNS